MAPVRTLLPSTIHSSSFNPPGTSRPTNTHACNLCGLSYKDASRLGRHKRDKHCDARFKCEHCDRQFQRPEGVKNHINWGRCPVLSSEPAHPNLPPSANIESSASRVFSSASLNDFPPKCDHHKPHAAFDYYADIYVGRQTVFGSSPERAS